MSLLRNAGVPHLYPPRQNPHPHMPTQELPTRAMVPFCIIRAWNGSSQKLDKKKVYHDTMSVTDHAARVRKCTRQDNRILETMRGLGEVSASDLEKILPDPIVSIRRSLNTLMNSGCIRRAGSKMSPLGHPERTYVVC